MRVVAAAMAAVTGEHDVTARLGGDEFVILLRTDRDRALLVTEMLRKAVATATDLPGGPPGLSVGVAALPDDADCVNTLKVASDHALYQAKSRGRGQVASAGRTGTYDLADAGIGKERIR